MYSHKNLFFIVLSIIICGCTSSEKASNNSHSLSVKNINIDENTYPVVILGGGVGGLTAAVYLAQAGLEPIVIEGKTPGGLITQSHAVENWPGEIKISGIDLANKIRAQALKCGAKIINQKVDAVDFSGWPYKIQTHDMIDVNKIQKITALSCIIVMGSQPNLLNIPGESGTTGYFGKGVTTCAICDGALYRDKVVAVVGGGNSAMTESLYLSSLARKVYVIVRADKLKASQHEQEMIKQKSDIELLFNSKIIEIVGDKNNVTSIILEKTKSDINQTEMVKELPVNGVFLAIGSTPNTQIFNNQLDLTDRGFIKLFNQQETSKPGIYGAGDISDDKFKQAITAAGDATKAALQAIEFLQDIGYTHIKKESSIALPENNSTKSAIITEIKSEKQFDEILSSANNKLIVADFYATYCIPCQTMAPIFHQLAESFENAAIFIKINVSENAALAKRFNIHSVPNFLFFKDGKKVKQFTGSTTFDALKDAVKKNEAL
ncbi:MAG: Thioredoxin reductase [candidate division TM6 bacterium GW2011_GWF2_36_6]|nr:MAG: Thioredoxin reductase [candidate division TM6 bacterium GW2011_GWF2_36_6]